MFNGGLQLSDINHINDVGVFRLTEYYLLVKLHQITYGNHLFLNNEKMQRKNKIICEITTNSLFDSFAT